VRGRAHRLDVANFDEMRMVADLRKAETGEQDAALMPEGVPSGVQVLSYSGTAVVKLDKIIERTKPAVVDQTGRPARGYVITGPPVTEPSEVTVRGAASRVTRVARVVVVVDVTGLNSTTTSEATLEARDNHDVVVSELTFKPERVKVTVNIKRVNNKPVAVRPQFGDPPPGWQVTAVQISPPVVTITGDGEVLASISSLATVPIDISGLRGTKSYRIPLSVPGKVSVLDEASVQVTVTTGRFRRTPGEPGETPEETETPEEEPAEGGGEAPEESPPGGGGEGSTPKPGGEEPPEGGGERPPPPEGGNPPGSGGRPGDNAGP